MLWMIRFGVVKKQCINHKRRCKKLSLQKQQYTNGEWLTLSEYDPKLISREDYWVLPVLLLFLVHHSSSCLIYSQGGKSCSLVLRLKKWDAQEKNSCSLVLKLKVFWSLYFQVLTWVLHTVYHESSALFLKMYQVLFSRDTSCESNCNRDCRGHPSGLTVDYSTPLHFTHILTLFIAL